MGTLVVVRVGWIISISSTAVLISSGWSIIPAADRDRTHTLVGHSLESRVGWVVPIITATAILPTIMSTIIIAAIVVVIIISA